MSDDSVIQQAEGYWAPGMGSGSRKEVSELIKYCRNILDRKTSHDLQLDQSALFSAVVVQVRKGVEAGSTVAPYLRRRVQEH